MAYGYLKTEQKFIAWLQKAMRKSFWTKHPVRLEMMKKGRKRLPNADTGRICFHHQCAHCEKWFPESKIEVNHKNTVGHLHIGNVGESFERLAIVTEEDLEKLCIECHSIVTYSERSGMTLEESAIEKKVIKYLNKANAAKQKADLIKAGYVPAKTEKLRRVQIREHLRKAAKLAKEES